MSAGRELRLCGPAVLFLTVLLSVGTGGYATAQQWRVVHSPSRDFTYKVIARDGTEHRTTVRYTARVWKMQYQTGHSANWPKTFRDTRQCHWNFARDHVRSHVSTIAVDSGAQETLRQPDRLDGDVYVADLLASDAEGLIRLIDQAALYAGAHELKAYWDRMTADGRDDFERTLWTIAAPVYVPVQWQGMAIARIFGLRKGSNCGEAGPAIDAAEKVYRQSIDAQVDVSSEIDHYLLWYELQRSWAYWSDDAQEWVTARRVTPLLRGEAFYPFMASRVRQIHLYWTGEEPTADLVRQLIADNSGDDWESAITRAYVETHFEQKFDEIREPPAFPPMDPQAILGLQRFSVGVVRVDREGTTEAAVSFSQGPPVEMDRFALARHIRMAGRFVSDACGPGTLRAILPAGATGSLEQDGIGEALVRRSLTQVVSSIPRMNAGQLIELLIALPPGDARIERVEAALDGATQVEVPAELGLALNPTPYRDCAIQAAGEHAVLRDLLAIAAGHQQPMVGERISEAVQGLSVSPDSESTIRVVASVGAVTWAELRTAEAEHIDGRRFRVPIAALVQAPVLSAPSDALEAVAGAADGMSYDERVDLAAGVPGTIVGPQTVQVLGSLIIALPAEPALFPRPGQDALLAIAQAATLEDLELSEVSEIRLP